MFLRGLFVFCKPFVFVGAHSQISSRSHIYFSKNLSIGNYCVVDALSKEGIHFGFNVSIGNNTKIECTGHFSNLGKGLYVGDNVGLGCDCFYGCAGGITIGNDVIVGNFVSFHSENHNFSDINIPIRYQGVNHKGIIVGNNCWIGAKATILDGAILEEGVIIAAGSIVTDGVYVKNGIYGGVPAKLIKVRS